MINWMDKPPTTDEEAIQFLHHGKNSDTFPTMDALYKLYREHNGMSIPDAVKEVLLNYIGKTGTV